MPDDVLQRAYDNSSYLPNNRLQLLQSEQSVAYAKSLKGLQLTLSGEVGFNKTGYSFSKAYSRLNDNEIVGLTLSLPLFDWGVSKGRVKIAEANLDVVKTEQEIADMEFRQQVRSQVETFNTQSSQFSDSRRMLEIAEERYQLTYRRFESGA